MQSRWFTNRARAEQFADRMEAKFRAGLVTMSDKDLIDMYAFVSERLQRTHARFIYVRERLEYKLNYSRAELMKRKINIFSIDK